MPYDGLSIKLVLQCDGKKPECLRCNRSKINCTGYDTFREQREVVWKKVVFSQRENKSTIEKSQTMTTKNDIKTQFYESPPPFGLSQDLEQQGVCFYFANLHPRLLGYYTDELPRAYGRENPTSFLSKAITALTSSFTSLHPQYSHFRPIAVSKYAECLRLGREAANDSQTVNSDAFLMAVFLLGTWEVSSCAASGVLDQYLSSVAFEVVSI